MRRTVTALVLIACSTTALAGDREEVMAAYQKMQALKSWHASTTGTAGKRPFNAEMDFVAPDRYRLQTEAGAQYVIGDTMIMTMQGQSMRVPLPKGMISQYRDPANLGKMTDSITFDAAGVDTLDGKPARKYRFRDSKHPETSNTLWIGSAGYVSQIRVEGRGTTTTVRYSRFNDPSIRIDPPK